MVAAWGGHTDCLLLLAHTGVDLDVRDQVLSWSFPTFAYASCLNAVFSSVI